MLMKQVYWLNLPTADAEAFTSSVTMAETTWQFASPRWFILPATHFPRLPSQRWWKKAAYKLNNISMFNRRKLLAQRECEIAQTLQFSTPVRVQKLVWLLESFNTVEKWSCELFHLAPPVSPKLLAVCIWCWINNKLLPASQWSYRSHS